MSRIDAANEPAVTFESLSSVMDTSSALKRLGNDRDLFHEIVTIYLEDAPTLLKAARQGLAAKDSVALRRAAHSLKGLTATLSADRAVTAALQLEQTAAAGDLASAQEPLDQLSRQVAKLNEVLQAYRNRVQDSH